VGRTRVFGQDSGWLAGHGRARLGLAVRADKTQAGKSRTGIGLVGLRQDSVRIPTCRTRTDRTQAGL
jgi:hypothetical protein